MIGQPSPPTAPGRGPAAAAWHTRWMARLGRRGPIVVILFAAAVVLYARTLLGTFDFDTPNLLLDNRAVHGLTLANLRAVLTTLPNGVEYLPVRDLSYMLDFELWGMRAAGFHLTNVLLYGASVGALFLLLDQLLVGRAQRPRAVAALGAALFALHPVHVESVAGIAQRKDVLSGLLCFGSLLVWQRWSARGGAGRYAAALALFALAMLSKATAIVLPGLALLVLAPGAVREARVRRGLAGLAAVGLVMGAASAAQAMGTGILLDSAGSPWLRLLTYGRAAAWYARILLVPWPLSIVRDLRPVADPWDAGALGTLALLGAVAALVAWRRQRWPVLAFALAWLLLAIVPVSGLAAAPNLVAERYLFLPSVGFCALLAWLLVEVIAPLSRPLALAAGVAASAASAGAVYLRVGEWRTNGGLLEADQRRAPGSARLAGLLGRYYFANGRYPEAFAMFGRAHTLDAGNEEGTFHAALLSFQTGDPAGALRWLDGLGDAGTVDALCLRGMALERMGALAEARAAYVQALRARRLLGIIFRTEADAGLARLAAAGR